MDTIWLIGRLVGEAQTLPGMIAAILPVAHVRRFDTLVQAIDSPAAAPDLVVVVQHRPHEYSQSDVEALIAATPLADLILAAGPWCASVMRSERFWPESVFVPIDDVPDRIRRLKRAADGSMNRLPLTAGRGEAAMFDLAPTPVLTELRAVTVAIATADAAFRALLIDVVRACDAVVVDEQSMPAGATVLWDVTSDIDVPRTITQIDRWHEFGCRVVALVALPTFTLGAQLQRCGVDVVVSKPFSRDALARSLADGSG